ncbi:MAG: DNA adenine methylase [Waterburya sp.]
MKPFLKWVGGKSKLLPQILPHVPNTFDTYYEPFLGSGALFFHLQPKNAVLSDNNEELINCYLQVRDNVHEVLKVLLEYDKAYQQDAETTYLEAKSLYNSATLIHSGLTTHRAAVFLFLNRTCFNGLYRVNKKGEFNVPWGKYKKPNIYNRMELLYCSNALQNTEIKVADFTDILDRPDMSLKSNHAFIYLDPPYYVCETSKFNSYGTKTFSGQQHSELVWYLKRLFATNTDWLLSNSNCAKVRELYKGFKIEEVHRSGTVSCRGDKRQPVSELLIRTF